MDLNLPGHHLAWFETLARERIVTETVENSVYGDPTIRWDILRTDLIHPICSGNKFFKLKYYLIDAIQKNNTTIITAGGAWSNHIVATAFAARTCGLRSVGLIRGEKSETPSDTLSEASDLGMDLRYISRVDFGTLTEPEPGEYYIPPGGYGETGAKGAGEMLDYAEGHHYTHIICASGTGTMLAGLTLAAPGKRVLGVAVLKHNDLGREAGKLIEREELEMIHDYHFGGYAKKTDELLAFMNEFFRTTGIPTDFVYTGKLMYAVKQLIQKQFFPPGSRILTIHSGGLQGNKSLKKGELVY
jgi:1-aminocyclopropane-1-carboxylate deaminase